MLLGIMHAASPLPKSPVISSYQHQKHLAENYRSLLHKMISSYIYCWWVEDASLKSPFVGPCIHTHTELWKGLILKPEIGRSPKSQARTRLEPDIYFWSPI